jgi:hypothetical protein
VFSVLPVKELLKFHFKEVMLDYLALYLCRYAARFLSYVVSHSFSLVML